MGARIWLARSRRPVRPEPGYAQRPRPRPAPHCQPLCESDRGRNQLWLESWPWPSFPDTIITYSAALVGSSWRLTACARCSLPGDWPSPCLFDEP